MKSYDINITKNTKLVAPWTAYANQVEMMFKEDKDIQFDYNDLDKVITLRVNGNDKAEALTKLLPTEKQFGAITVKINVIPANKLGEDKIDLFCKAFSGNPAVSEITTVETLWGPLNFVVFAPKVVQYYDDTLFDLNGIHTTIYQDLAKEVFGTFDGLCYCTEKVEE